MEQPTLDFDRECMALAVREAQRAVPEGVRLHPRLGIAEPGGEALGEDHVACIENCRCPTEDRGMHEGITGIVVSPN
jgi:hypothetical protein